MIACHLIAMFTRFGQYQQGLSLPGQDLRCGQLNLLLEPARTIFDYILLMPDGQQIATTRFTLVLIQRSGQKIRGSRLISHINVIDHSDNDYRQIFTVQNFTYAPGKLDTIHSRHSVVGKDQIGFVMSDKL